MGTNYKFVIGIREKVPYKISGPEYIVTDNNDYTLELVPDAEWDGLEAKTVYYAFDTGEAIVHPVVGNEDAMPVFTKARMVYIGVSAGDLRTTKALGIRVHGSVRQMAGVQVPEPESDVYDKIMEQINQLPDALYAAENAKNAAESAGKSEENAAVSAEKAIMAANEAGKTLEEAAGVIADAESGALKAVSEVRMEAVTAVQETGDDQVQRIKESAQASMDAAEQFASAAGTSAEKAEEAADRAEQVAVANGYVDFELDNSDGILYLLRTDNIVDEIDFELDENTGMLEVIIQ